MLIEKIDGNYDNAVGSVTFTTAPSNLIFRFPSAPFWQWMSELDAGRVFDEAWGL